MSKSPNRTVALRASVALMVAGIALRTVPRSLHWPLPLAVHHGGGGFLWGGTVYSLLVATRPSRWHSGACLAATLTIVVFVEGSRLLHAPALDAFRLTFAGQWLLGRVFAPLNIVIDGLGAISTAMVFGFIPHPSGGKIS